MGTRLLRLVMGCLIVGLAAPAGADDARDAYFRHLKAGRKVFYEQKDYVAAQAHFEKAANVEGLERKFRASAEFWVLACVSNGSDKEPAVAMAYRWLARWPESDHRSYVRYFLGIHLKQLGRSEEARDAWETLLEDDPESSLAPRVREMLGGVTPTAPAAKEITVSVPARDPHVGPYVVVSLGSSEPSSGSNAYATMAQEIAAWHKATLVTASLQDVPGLVARLRTLRPQQVLVVLEPQALDLALHRTLLLASSKHDDDPLPDFTFGYFTARTPETLKALWARTRALHDSGIKNKTWVGTSITSGAQAIDTPRIAAIAGAAGFEGSHLYFAMPGKVEGAQAFLDANWRRLEQASVIAMTGCGDPESIWLFDDGRNADRSKHWAFDPKKVGQDPDGEMPRIDAKQFRSLKLSAPIVWSGTCHSGATGPVFVEGDIVSTFGRTEHVTRYDMPLERSLALAILDAGATAFLCPLGANHGMSVSREVDFTLSEGASLGEALKSTYDDIHLAANDGLKLTIPVPGEPHARAEPVMQGGGANRVLLGDPALRPFQKTAHPSETLTITPAEGGLDVTVHWKAGFHARGWDMFGTDRIRDWQLTVRIPLDDWPTTKEPTELTISLLAVDENGAELPYGLVRAVVETFHGHRYLHIKATAPRAKVQQAAVAATFKIRLQEAHGR